MKNPRIYLQILLWVIVMTLSTAVIAATVSAKNTELSINVVDERNYAVDQFNLDHSQLIEYLIDYKLLESKLVVVLMFGNLPSESQRQHAAFIAKRVGVDVILEFDGKRELLSQK